MGSVIVRIRPYRKYDEDYRCEDYYSYHLLWLSEVRLLSLLLPGDFWMDAAVSAVKWELVFGASAL